jgi:hypothetical protein
VEPGSRSQTVGFARQHGPSRPRGPLDGVVGVQWELPRAVGAQWELPGAMAPTDQGLVPESDPVTGAFCPDGSPSCALSGRRDAADLRLPFPPSCAPSTFSASPSGRPSVGSESRGRLQGLFETAEEGALPLSMRDRGSKGRARAIPARVRDGRGG